MAKQYPTKYQLKTIWKAITGVSMLILFLLTIGVIWATSTALAFLQPVLVPVAIAGVIAYLLDPIVGWLQKSKGFSRTKSVITVFLSFLCIITLLALIIVPPIVKQINDAEQREKVGQNIQFTLQRLGKTPWIKPAVDWALAKHTDKSTQRNTTAAQPASSAQPKPAQTAQAVKFSETNLAYTLSENTEKIIQMVTKFVASTIMGTFGFLIGLAMVPIYLYYFLKETSAIKANWHQYVPLKASRFKNEVISTLQEINGYLISFFRGQVLVAMIDGILVGIALTVFRLPYGILIGLILGIIGIIPFIGNILCLIPACIIAYAHFSVPENCASHAWLLGYNPWTYVAAVAAIFFIVQQINSLVTAPKIVGESVGLHPMTVIFSMLFWSLILGGFLGTLLAVPMTAAVKVLFRRYIWEHKIHERPLNLDDSIDIESEVCATD